MSYGRVQFLFSHTWVPLAVMGRQWSHPFLFLLFSVGFAKQAFYHLSHFASPTSILQSRKGYREGQG
jgi:hypothetical protein